MIEGTKIANYILQNSKNRLSNLELQKYLYSVDVNFTKKFNINLIEDNFEAWQLGPVITEVYWKYRNYGANSIDIPIEEVNLELEERYMNNINESIAFCDNFNYWELVGMIHFKDGAWDIAYKEGTKKVINKEYFRNMGMEIKELLK